MLQFEDEDEDEYYDGDDDEDALYDLPIGGESHAHILVLEVAAP